MWREIDLLILLNKALSALGVHKNSVNIQLDTQELYHFHSNRALDRHVPWRLTCKEVLRT